MAQTLDRNTRFRALLELKRAKIARALAPPSPSPGRQKRPSSTFQSNGFVEKLTFRPFGIDLRNCDPHFILRKASKNIASGRSYFDKFFALNLKGSDIKIIFQHRWQFFKLFNSLLPFRLVELVIWLLILRLLPPICISIGRILRTNSFFRLGTTQTFELRNCGRNVLYIHLVYLSA
jgi:hypothetical protein